MGEVPAPNGNCCQHLAAIVSLKNRVLLLSDEVRDLRDALAALKRTLAEREEKPVLCPHCLQKLRCACRDRGQRLQDADKAQHWVDANGVGAP